MDAAVKEGESNLLYLTTNRLPFMEEGVFKNPLTYGPNFRIVQFEVEDVSYLSP